MLYILKLYKKYSLGATLGTYHNQNPMITTAIIVLLYIYVNSVYVMLEECKQDCGGQKGRSGVWRRVARSQ